MGGVGCCSSAVTSQGLLYGIVSSISGAAGGAFGYITGDKVEDIIHCDYNHTFNVTNNTVHNDTKDKLEVNDGSNGNFLKLSHADNNIKA